MLSSERFRLGLPSKKNHGSALLLSLFTLWKTTIHYPFDRFSCRVELNGLLFPTPFMPSSFSITSYDFTLVPHSTT